VKKIKISIVIGLLVGVTVLFLSMRFMGVFSGEKNFVEKNIETVSDLEKKDERETWLTVFVHGSFGSLLGLFNAYNVIKDKVEGTTYKKIVSKMRSDTFFFREQPLLERGLIKVEPSFDLFRCDNKKFAVYPLFKIYEKINELCKPGKEKNHFYTFGWSGLLSQRRRCHESIRLFNSLCEELEKYRAKGLYPKVRILTHSHGGNLVAYLGAVSDLMNRNVSTEGEESSTCSKSAALANMTECFKNASDKSVLQSEKGQKRWDYEPRDRSLFVDEVILWGMPVQPETDCLFASSIFKDVYHFYSDEDLVQRLDWISTKQRYSDRRFDAERLREIALCSNKKNSFIQSRITVNRRPGEKAKEKVPRKRNLEKKESFWSVLFSGGSILTPSSLDPTHKELWFFTWNEATSDVREFVLEPFPVAIFSPALIHLIKRRPELCDVDINIKKKGGIVSFELSRYDEMKRQSEYLIQKDFFEAMRSDVEPWRPKEVSVEEVFNIMRKYVDRL